MPNNEPETVRCARKGCPRKAVPEPCHVLGAACDLHHQGQAFINMRKDKAAKGGTKKAGNRAKAREKRSESTKEARSERLRAIAEQVRIGDPEQRDRLREAMILELIAGELSPSVSQAVVQLMAPVEARGGGGQRNAHEQGLLDALTKAKGKAEGEDPSLRLVEGG